MFIRDFRHLLPDGPGTGTGAAAGGDGAASSGASGQGAGTGSTGTGDGGQSGSGVGSGSQGGTGEPVDVSGLPQWAQDHIRGLRTENAGHRQGKTAAEAAKTQAETDKAAIVEAAKVALGLAEAPNAEQLGDQLRTAQAETRQARVEAAIARTAGVHNADPAKLLDSRGFLATVDALDPAAADFTTKVGEAIKAGVEANPSLKAATSGGSEQQNGAGARRLHDPSQGSSGRGQGASASTVQSGRDLYRQRRGKSAAAGSS